MAPAELRSGGCRREARAPPSGWGGGDAKTHERTLAAQNRRWEDGAEERALLGTSHISRLGASIGGAVAGRAGRTTLAAIDAVGDSRFAAEASERLPRSGLV